VKAAIAAFALALVAQAAGAAQVSPMESLARDLGTPKIGYTARDDTHTHTMFEWVRSGETVQNWTKLFTVIATAVPNAQTRDATRATILRIRALLGQKHAKISAFDVRNQVPPVAYFNYVLGPETDVGVIFSPGPGVVTIQQVAAHGKGIITAKDIRRIKQLVGYPG
jgi:hypothetical protein